MLKAPTDQHSAPSLTRDELQQKPWGEEEARKAERKHRRVQRDTEGESAGDGERPERWSGRRSAS